jgi:hypothetical protein
VQVITLSHGEHAFIDDADYAMIAAYRWYLHHGYAVTISYPRLRMHRLVLNAPLGIGVDHINGDGLDNRRANLRLANDSQNQANRRRLTSNTSGYRGVTLHRQSGRWQAGIKVRGRSVHLGLHDSPIDAALAYDQAAIRYFGVYARPNFGVPA